MPKPGNKHGVITIFSIEWFSKGSVYLFTQQRQQKNGNNLIYDHMFILYSIKFC